MSDQAHTPLQLSPLEPRKSKEPPLRIMDNPLLIAQARRQLRQRQLGITVGIGLVLGLLTILSIFATRQSQFFGGEELEFLSTLWASGRQTLTFIILYSLYWRGGSVISSAITGEKSSGIFTFLKATPLSPLSLAFGYLFGLPIRGYLLTLTILPFWMYCGLMEGVGVLSLIIGMILILLGAITLHSMILAFSFSQEGKTLKWGAPLLKLGLFIFAEPLNQMGLHTVAHLTPFPSLGSLELTLFSSAIKREEVSFYAFSMPSIFYTLLIQGLMIGLCLWVTSRKINYASQPLMSRVGGLSVLIVLLLTLIGVDLNPNAINMGAQMNTSFSKLPGGMILLVLGILLGALLIFISAPSRLSAIRDMSRQRRLVQEHHSPQIPWSHEGASIFPLTLLIVVITTALMCFYFYNYGGPFYTDLLWSEGIFSATLSASSCLIAFSGICEYLKSNSHRWRYLLTLQFYTMLLFLLPIILGLIWGQVGEQSQLIYALSPLYSFAYAIIHLAFKITGEHPEVTEHLQWFTLNYFLFSSSVGVIIGGACYRLASQARQTLFNPHQEGAEASQLEHS